MASLRLCFAVLTVLLLLAYASADRPTERPADAAAPVRSFDQLVVHEWGTFTSMQDEQGRQLSGINTDDEPVPHFVHRQRVVQPVGDMPMNFYKGIAASHPDVLVRLETPVLYFYPPKGQPNLKLDVEVKFRGGWLTEYYPKADVAGIDRDTPFIEFPPLPAKAVGSLLWKDLTVGGRADGPKTDSKVWLAPRQVDAASVRTADADSETERYLFYRGVGNLPVPLTVKRAASDATLLQLRSELPLHTVTLVDVRGNGTLAFRGLDELPANVDAPLPLKFEPTDYAQGNLARLRDRMFKALVREGLFEEEAEAMMNTWEAAYFKNTGTRVFFLVPDAWTDATLPLSVRAGDEVKGMKIERAMIGRVELVTVAHREALARIAKTPPTPESWIQDIWKSIETDPDKTERRAMIMAINSGAKSFLQSDFKIPVEYRDYLAMGRFRNTLVLDELKHRPTAHLRQFATQYAIRYSRTSPATEPAARP